VLAVAGLFMLGIAAHRSAPMPIYAWLIIAACCACAAMLLHHRERVCELLLGVAIVACGVAAGQTAHGRYPAHDIATLAGDEPRLADVEMRLLHPPRLVTHPMETGRPLPPKQVTSAEVVRVRTWRGWEPASGQMLVQVLEPHPELAVGQTVRALGMLQRPAPAMNPGQFDWASYYREQRILSSIQIAQAENLAILASPGAGPLQWLREQVRCLLATGFSADQALDHALLRALLLGDNDPDLRDVQDDFRRTGTSHHLSISGMHVAVLGGFVFLLCRVMLVPPRAALVTMMVFVIVYGLVALPSPPVVRSVLLCLAIGIGRIGRRSVDAIQLLALSVLAMLIYHPLDLFSPGFQLSFGTVLGLMVFTTPLAEWLAGPADPDLLALARGGHTSRWQMLVWRTDRTLMTAVAAGIVAWTVSMPLIATHFEQMNPWAIVAGLALAPVVLAALVCGLLKVVLTLLWPSLAGAWATMAAGPIAAMRNTVDALASVPGSDVPLPAPPWWLLLIYYALLALPLVRFASPTLRWLSRGAPLVACASILLLPFHTTLVRAQRGSGELRITFLAVGAGQCAVLEPPSGRIMLIDAGSTSLGDTQMKCLGPYLRHRGITDIDTIVLTHANYDHFSSAGELARAYDVREVLVSPHFAVHAQANPPAQALLRELDVLNRPPRVVAPGQAIPLGRDSALTVLWPPDDPSLDSNNASLVLRITHGSRRILVTGDMQDHALRALLDRGDAVQLRADVLLAPHHGGAEPSTAEFVSTVDPPYIIASDDRTQTARQRQFDQLAAGRNLYRTHQWGAITVTIGDDGAIRLDTHLKEPQP
jgi:competence protein ComEC